MGMEDLEADDVEVEDMEMAVHPKDLEVLQPEAVQHPDIQDQEMVGMVFV